MKRLIIGSDVTAITRREFIYKYKIIVNKA